MQPDEDGVTVERPASVIESKDTTLLAVALHVASTTQPFPEPGQVSPPIQNAVQEFLFKQAEVSKLTPFVHDPDAGQTVEESQM